MRNTYLLLIGLFLYCFVSVSFTKNIVVRADELKEEVEEIIEEETRDYEDLEEIESDNNDEQQILFDTYGSVTENDNDFEEDKTDDTDRDYVPEDTEEDEEIMNNNQQEFYVMIIFSLGLVSGVIVGHFLTGFIK